jgi:lysophospholipase L1-like esterase
MKKALLVRVAALVLLAAAIVCRAGDEPIRVACIGDSITFGAGVENRNVNHYPLVLNKLLGDKYVVKNFGVSGATLLKQGDKPYWNLKEFKDAGDFNPNLIVIKLGTNDTKPQNWKNGAEFAGDLAAMVDHFAALPAKPKIFLCLPVPVYETKWGINEKDLTAGVIPAIKKVAEEKKLPTIDLYAALTNHPEMFPDKIHPNAAGAELLAKTVAGAIGGK